MKAMQAEQIRRYEGPQYLVQPRGSMCDEEALREIEERGDVIEGGLLGWSPYTHIVRCDGVDYLVQIA